MSIKRIILKEISPRQQEFFEENDFEVIAHVALQDYDLILLRHPYFYQDSEYTIGFQKKGRDFTDPFDQHHKERVNEINFDDLIKIPKILKEWVDKYGTLVLGSYNEKKTNIYKKVLWRYGFNIEEKSIMGINALIIN